MADVYPDSAGDRLPDDEWIRRASDEGWIALTKDYAIVRDHIDTISSTTLRIFSLNNANLTGPEMVTRISDHLNRIIQRAAKPGPYVYVITRGGLELRWPRQDTAAN